jgi:hypothetical protein
MMRQVLYLLDDQVFLEIPVRQLLRKLFREFRALFPKQPNNPKTLVKKENHDDIQKCQIII